MKKKFNSNCGFKKIRLNFFLKNSTTKKHQQKNLIRRLIFIIRFWPCSASNTMEYLSLSICVFAIFCFPYFSILFNFSKSNLKSN